MLKHHQGLRDLKERRRREQTEAKLADSKPLEDILESLLKKSPTLANLFLQGASRIEPVQDDQGPRGGRRGEAVPGQAVPDVLQVQGQGLRPGNRPRDADQHALPHHVRDGR